MKGIGSILWASRISANLSSRQLCGLRLDASGLLTVRLILDMCEQQLPTTTRIGGVLAWLTILCIDKRGMGVFNMALDDELESLIQKHGRELVMEIGRVFLADIRMWQIEYATQATNEAIEEAIELNSIGPLLRVQGAELALSCVEELIAEIIDCEHGEGLE